MTKDRKLAYLALFLTSVIWGIAPPIIKSSLRSISPVNFLLYRFTIASIIFAIPLGIRLKKIKPSQADLAKYAFLGFLAAPLNLVLLFSGIARTTAIDASIISILSPILIIIGGAVFLKENINKTEKTGIVITIIGSIVTIIQPFLSQVENDTNFIGNILVLLGAIVWAAFSILSKREQKNGLDPFILSASSFFVGTVTIIPLAIAQGPIPLLGLSNPAIPGILYMSLMASVVAYSTYIWGFSKIEASEATVFTYLQPVFGIPIAAIFLKEMITLPFVVGAILIGAGFYICEKR